MPFSDQLVITGGSGRSNKGLSNVQVYTVQGPKERLPDLNQPRRNHACGYFYTGNKLVILGHSGNNNKYLCIFPGVSSKRGSPPERPGQHRAADRGFLSLALQWGAAIS